MQDGMAASGIMFRRFDAVAPQASGSAPAQPEIAIRKDFPECWIFDDLEDSGLVFLG
jgi:hypothetical protein